MKSILIIKDNEVIDPDFPVELETLYKVYFAQDAREGLDIINEYYIDLFVIMSGDHTKRSIKNFLKELYSKRSKFTPIIFIAEKPSKTLQSKLYTRSGWCFIKYPIERENFSIVIKNATEMASLFDDDKYIVLTKNMRREKHVYKVIDITRIQRSKPSYIKVYSRNALTSVEEEKEFFYRESLQKFLEDYDIGKRFKQAQQSWLVNISEVKKIRKADLTLILNNGVEVPTSKKYIANFRNK